MRQSKEEKEYLQSMVVKNAITSTRESINALTWRLAAMQKELLEVTEERTKEMNHLINLLENGIEALK